MNDIIKGIRTSFPPPLKKKYTKYRQILMAYILKLSIKGEVSVISYPKCGRTWLRLLIGKYICESFNYPERFALRVHLITKYAGLNPTLFIHDKSANPDLKFNKLSKNKKKYKKKKVIFLARGIKDTLVSHYFQTKKRIKIFQGTLSEFIHSEYFGVKKIVNFYNTWYINRSIPKDFLFIRYENLHENPHDVLRQILIFIGLKNIDDIIIKKSIEFTKFENMKKIERDNYFKDGRLGAKNKNDSNTYKVRRGIIGGYREYLNESDINYIDQIIKEMGCPFESHSYYKHIRLFKNH